MRNRMSRAALRAIPAALLLSACAASRPSMGSVPPPSRTAKLLPKSSITAVLAHRSELGLDDEQVRRLEAIDVTLQRQQLGVGMPTPSSAGASPRPDAGAGAGGDPPSRKGGRHREGGPGRGRRDPDHASAPETTWDENDTAAYYRAEQILGPEQRDRAREIAEQYREELYDQRAEPK
jgi:hypothetical protein